MVVEFEKIWKRKYEEEIKEIMKMTPQKRFELTMELYSVGLKLIKVSNTGEKLKFYQKMSKVRKEKIKEFIREQLEKRL